MKSVLHQTATQRVELLEREPGEMAIRHRVDQSQIVQSNQAIKSSDLLKPGDRAAYHPQGAEAIYHFQIDPILWKVYQREHPDVYAALNSRVQAIRENAAAQLAREHPEWVACAPTVRRFC